MNRPKACAAVCAALLLPAFVQAQQVASGHAERAARVEASLTGSIQIKGRTRTAYTLADRMAFYNVPGVSIAVIDSGRIVWARGYGVKDVETGEPVTIATLFQAASISKPVATVAMLTLVEAGRLDLDAAVNGYLKSWQVPPYAFDEPITLRRIVSHTAGFTVHGFPGYARSANRPTTAGVLRGEGNTDPVFVDIEPGSQYRYSGGGFTVMQQLVEDVTGQPFPEFMQRAVLDPVGMQSSTYMQPLPESRWGDAATAYRANGTKVEEDWHVYPEMAAAGLWTTPTDLATFAIELQRSLHGESNRVLSQAMVREMLTPVMQNYGLGFGTGTGPDARFGHGGANEGFRATLTAFYERGSGVAIMTNSDRGSALASELLFAVATEYGWPGVAPREVQLVELPAARRDALVGTYRVQSMGIELRLEATDDGMFRLTGLGDAIPQTTLAPTSQTTLLDIGDGTLVTIEWDGDQVVRLRTQGVEVVPVR